MVGAPLQLAKLNEKRSKAIKGWQKIAKSIQADQERYQKRAWQKELPVFQPEGEGRNALGWWTRMPGTVSGVYSESFKLKLPKSEIYPLSAIIRHCIVCFQCILYCLGPCAHPAARKWKSFIRLVTVSSVCQIERIGEERCPKMALEFEFEVELERRVEVHSGIETSFRTFGSRGFVRSPNLRFFSEWECCSVHPWGTTRQMKHSD